MCQNAQFFWYVPRDKHSHYLLARCLHFHRSPRRNLAMGKLNIAHHKSYHPYRRDNIERVRRDEEEAREKEAREEGRMMLAASLLSVIHDRALLFL